MTQMSESVDPDPSSIRSNIVDLRRGSSLARAVHIVLGEVFRLSPLVISLGGCVIPPNISVGDQDAGVNSPPAIVAVRSDVEELANPGPVVFDVGPSAGNLTIDLVDTDTADTLYVRVFVDYNRPSVQPARATCTGVT